MARWITNWPGGGAKWASCSPAFAAQVAAEGRCSVRLVKNTIRLTRHLLITPAWARTFAQRNPAVALARRLSPLDRFRAANRAAA